MSVYTVGIWVVKAGQEQAFIDAWQAMAAWTVHEMGGTGSGTLLRDRDHANRFVSFGPWDSIETIEAWRKSPGFQDRVGKMKVMLEEFSPMTLDEVVGT